MPGARHLSLVLTPNLHFKKAKEQRHVVEKKGKDILYQVGLFRYGIICELLVRPPEAGMLSSRLTEIAGRNYKEPWSEREANFSVRTLERWLAIAKKAQFPSHALQPKPRSDFGTSRKLCLEHIGWLNVYRIKFPSWSVRLMFDNMLADKHKTTPPSYSTILRYLKGTGYTPQKYLHKRKQAREVQSFEVEYVGELVHMDFHKGSRKIIDSDGEYKQAICCAIVDDKSRLVCHVQWYLNETTEVLVHSMIQALMKRGLPRHFYSDCGSAMRGYEFEAGLKVLDITQKRTMPFSPYQNGKQEAFWQPLEGRLLKMLPANKRITLDVLNAATQAWVEQDYHMQIHSETKERPIDRFFNSKNVLRPALDISELKRAFRVKVTRAQRQTDCTVTLDGVRFQVPQQYKNHESLILRYARWDLGEAEILCPRTSASLAVIHPVNLIYNAAAVRKPVERADDEDADCKNFVDTDNLLSLDDFENIPPLLARCLREHARTFESPGYIPLQKSEVTKNES